MDVTPFVFSNDVHPTWSIMIVLYPYITGLVADAFVVSALYHVFHLEVLKPVHDWRCLHRCVSARWPCFRFSCT